MCRKTCYKSVAAKGIGFSEGSETSNFVWLGDGDNDQETKCPGGRDGVGRVKGAETLLRSEDN